MPRANRNSGQSFSDQFKPAIHLSSPTLEQWSEAFYAEALQESYDETGQIMLRLGRAAPEEASLPAATRLISPEPDFTPTVRRVEISDKKDYTALCIDGGVNSYGVYLYLRKTVDTGGNCEHYINQKFLPFSMLGDLVVGTTKAGLLELRLPETEIVKLNVTLRASAAHEPEFRTFKTEVLIDSISSDTRVEIENSLNFDAASVAAYLGYQLLRANGEWPARPEPAPAAVEGPGAPPDLQRHKQLIVATSTSFGSFSLGLAFLRNNQRLGFLGAFLIAAGETTGLWIDYFQQRRLPRIPPQPPLPPQPPKPFQPNRNL